MLQLKEASEPPPILIATLTKRFKLLVRNPEIGRQRNDLAKGIRSFPVGSYLIYYRADKGIRIHRILHAAREENG